MLSIQNIDEYIRRELNRNRNDSRMAAIIKFRYDTMSTVYLDTGMCERIYLDSANDLKIMRNFGRIFPWKICVKELIE